MPNLKHIRESVDHEDSKYFHMDWKKDKKGKTHGNVVFPNDYIKCKSKHDLEDLLSHYGEQHVTWWMALPNKAWARRAFVERVRPALRFYCEKYQVEIPAWLKNDEPFEKMPATKKQELFGVPEIHIVHFKKLNIQPMIQPHAK